MSEKCPKCGAKFAFYMGAEAVFVCGSIVKPNGEFSMETHVCDLIKNNATLTAQLADVTRERDEALGREAEGRRVIGEVIAQIANASDMMDGPNEFICSDCLGIGTYDTDSYIPLGGNENGEAVYCQCAIGQARRLLSTPSPADQVARDAALGKAIRQLGCPGDIRPGLPVYALNSCPAVASETRPDDQICGPCWGSFAKTLSDESDALGGGE